ncbi:hypothetical protein ACFW1A_34475 [Kitasatospora sp. NPDC058965]|uniref:hypothetical protein n=1 Tax=Kitasatospora sp. NPDC058965 TaxID=3346682 RepID=UPI00367BF34B
MSTAIAPVGGTTAVLVGGDVYPVTVEPTADGTGTRRLVVGEPAGEPGAGADDLLVATMAAGVADAARRHLDHHRIDRTGLRVTAEFRADRTRSAGPAVVRLRLTAPGLPQERMAGLLAVAHFCADHCVAGRVPEVVVELVTG